MARALASGTTTDGVLAMLKEVTPELSCPVVLFSYFNPIVRWGLADFAAAAKEAGAHGLIVPDLPYAATCAVRSEAMKNKLELVGTIHRRAVLRPVKQLSDPEQWLLAGAAHNTNYTGREDEEDHKSFRRFHLPCKCP
jgi:tryptophan synthase alpha subunit